jgi:membrane-bound lytic murein transglycosylase B
MHRRNRSILVLVGVLFLLSAPAVRAQTAKAEAKEPSQVLITIFNVGAGKHLDFLKWMADQEAIAREAGVPAPQMYSHTSGASWDYLTIGPVLTNEQQAKIDEVTRKRGRKTGFAQGLEIRAFVSSHTDTTAIGPVSAADLVSMAK